MMPHDWAKTLHDLGAVHRDDPNGKRVHVNLTGSFRHSNLYVDISRLTEIPHLLERACTDLLQKAGISVGGEHARFVGSAMGGITIAHECARQTGVCMSYTEKTGHGTLMEFKRAAVQPGDRVYVVEDQITSGKTTHATMHAIEVAGGIILPPILAISTRRITSICYTPIVSLAQIVGHEWTTENDSCELCREGVPLISTPKKHFR